MTSKPSTGVVKLIGDSGKAIHEEEYKSISGRRNIINKWKLLHPDKEFFNINICPTDEPVQYKEVIIRKKELVIPDLPKPLTRHPAKYSNQQWV
jgi:hypothetical protein